MHDVFSKINTLTGFLPHYEQNVNFMLYGSFFITQYIVFFLEKSFYLI